MKLRIPLFPQINRWLSGAAVLFVCGAVTASADSYVETVLADNPVAYYRFEEAADELGSGRDVLNSTVFVIPEHGGFSALTNQLAFPEVRAFYYHGHARPDGFGYGPPC